ncbi:hypothetical protein [Oceanobacillus sp. AG]|uniref:hypothetical protein n=1 Tax=Oceanobacillus sp. AG TaxID=2681969 RepID=UPI0012EC298B|nr:hypothetical protein [Oceanobacillus sp. AG]
MKKKKLHKWVFTLAGIGGLIGMTFGQFIFGKLDFSGILGSLSAVILFFIIDLVKNRMKKDDTPDFDERTTHNVVKYYAYFSTGFIAVAFLLLAVVTASGLENVNISYLWILIFIYMLSSGIGAFIVSKK